MLASRMSRTAARPAPLRRRWHLADLGIVAFLVILLTLVVAYLGSKFDYLWNWNKVFSYVANNNEDGWKAGLILTGFANMLRLVIIAGLTAAIAGVFLGLAGMSKNPGLRFSIYVYIESIRSLPLVVFVFVFYYFISLQILPTDSFNYSNYGLAWLFLGDKNQATELLAGALCLGFYEAAYVAEIVRGGLLSVTRNVREAAQSIGLGPFQSLRLIVLPLALRRTTPPLTSQAVLLVKDSSVMSIISVQELTFTGLEVANTTLHIFESLFLISVLYMLICVPMTLLAGTLELRVGQGGTH